MTDTAKPVILFVLHMPPPVHGAAMVGKFIHDSSRINQLFDCHYIDLATAASIEDIGKVGLKKLWNFILLFYSIWHEVRKNTPQLVYITPNAKGGAFYKDWIIVMMLKAMGCTIVAHYHNKGVANYQDRKIDNWLYKYFFKNLKVILLADNLYQDIEKYVRREDVFICPNGIPVEKIVSHQRKEKCQLLFLSNLIVSKGVIDLLDACSILKGNGVVFECLFVGAETDEMTSDRFSQEVKNRGLEGRVHYLGKKYGEEKESIWNDADIFVFPTFYPNECFPLVLLEAMQHGLPCVSTDEGAISGIIEDGITGFIVERKNPEQLAKRIQQLLSDANLRHSMGVAGRQKFEEEYTLSVFEKRMSDIFLQILSERK